MMVQMALVDQTVNRRVHMIEQAVDRDGCTAVKPVDKSQARSVGQRERTVLSGKGELQPAGALVDIDIRHGRAGDHQGHAGTHRERRRPHRGLGHADRVVPT